MPSVYPSVCHLSIHLYAICLSTVTRNPCEACGQDELDSPTSTSERARIAGMTRLQEEPPSPAAVCPNSPIASHPNLPFCSGKESEEAMRLRDRVQTGFPKERPGWGNAATCGGTRMGGPIPRRPSLIYDPVFLGAPGGARPGPSWHTFTLANSPSVAPSHLRLRQTTCTEAEIGTGAPRRPGQLPQAQVKCWLSTTAAPSRLAGPVALQLVWLAPGAAPRFPLPSPRLPPCRHGV